MGNKTFQTSNSKIAKNTILLYTRTLITMMLALYTSRLVLSHLGVDDYGIYNVVGGIVGMFAVISAALSSTISRFITYTLGKGEIEKLKLVFSTSINIQVCLTLLLLLIGEVAGVWYVNNKMAVPAERLYAANWVLQFSLITFGINLLSVPFKACIIAYEKMSIYAYISIIEALLKLVICFILAYGGFDKLIFYSLLIMFVALVIFLLDIICSMKAQKECRYVLVKDKSVFYEMTGFAGWSFLTNIAWVFNTQGVTLIINAFFGVAVNAARAIASQVESAVIQFVNSFTVAINPQITKSYAAGNMNDMFQLVCRGAKFTYFLYLFFASPIILETGYILSLWLKIVPDLSPLFIRLSMISSMISILGNSCYTACMATGKIKKYVLWVTTVGALVFPMTLVAYKIGLPVEYAYINFIIVYLAIDIVRLLIMREQINFPISKFLVDVIMPITYTTLVGVMLPALIHLYFDESFIRLFLVCITNTITVSISIYFIGLTKTEKSVIKDKIIGFVKKTKYNKYI